MPHACDLCMQILNLAGFTSAPSQLGKCCFSSSKREGEPSRLDVVR